MRSFCKGIPVIFKRKTMKRWLPLLLGLYACRAIAPVNYDKARKEILALNEQQRDYHFNKQAKAITDLSSDSFLLVDGGRFFQPQREAQLKNFESYFGSVDFIKWDDVKPPDIRFSKDASIAYVSVEKLVILKGLGASGREVIDTSHFAWMSIYKKTKKGWQLDAIASTRKPKP
jgi:hypothetical protein